MSLRRGDDNTYYYGEDYAEVTKLDEGERVLAFTDVAFERMDPDDSSSGFHIVMRGLCLAHASLYWDQATSRWTVEGIGRPGSPWRFVGKEIAMTTVAEHLMGDASIGVVGG